MCSRRTQRESFYPYLERAVLEPMGLEHSAFEPLPAIRRSLAKGTMWTIDGRRFDAPTFQLGMGPCGSMYSTVLDLGRFRPDVVCARRGVERPARARRRRRSTRCGRRSSQRPVRRPDTESGSTSDSWTDIATIGHGGAIYGFATQLLALPDDSLGVVVTATLDGANAVTDHIADIGAAADARRARRASRSLLSIRPRRFRTDARSS